MARVNEIPDKPARDFTREERIQILNDARQAVEFVRMRLERLAELEAKLERKEGPGDRGDDSSAAGIGIDSQSP